MDIPETVLAPLVEAHFSPRGSREWLLARALDHALARMSEAGVSWDDVQHHTGGGAPRGLATDGPQDRAAHRR